MALTRMRSLCAPLAGLCVSLAGCKGNGGSADPAPSACSAFATVLAECGGGGVGAPDAVAAEVACAESLALPGSPPPSAFQACTSAIAATACADGVSVPECDLRGSLAGGAACNTYLQCQSAVCSVPAGGTCGTCAAVIPAGQACPAGAGCGTGATCLGGVCTSVAHGVVGASCDGVAKLCESSLYCEVTTGRCASPPGDARTCGRTSGSLVCAPPDVCDEQTSRCVPANGAGEPCPCRPGLSCAPTEDGGAGTCLNASGVSPGQPCTQTELCATGACDPSTLVCPAVLADGQACQNGSTSAVCANDSTCVDGACASVASTVVACK